MPAPSEPALEAPRTLEVKREPNRWKRFLKLLGPGLITGASDDDPSGIGTYSQAGAQLGFATLWTALLSFPLMAAVQFICAKIGLVTGQGLAGVIRQHYPRWLLMLTVSVLVIANVINIGADLGAMAAAVHLIIPQIPAMAAIFPVTAILVALLTFGSFSLISRIFKWLTLALFAYIIAAFLAHPDWNAVLHHTFVPTIGLDQGSLSIYVAILGTTISPYLFFWQSYAEVEEQRNAGYSLWKRVGASDDDLKYCAADVNCGMFFSNLVMYFIILTTGATLYKAGMHTIVTANQAATALRPLAGDLAALLFAVGLIGTGALGVPVLAGSCAYALSSAFGWRRGLSEKWYRAPQFYAVILIACGLGMEMDFFNLNPMLALFWTAILNGLLAPPLLVMIMLISGNKKIMGDRVNSLPVSLLGWAATILMTAAAAGLIITSIQ